MLRRMYQHSTDAHVVDQPRGVSTRFDGTAEENHSVRRPLGGFGVCLYLDSRARLLLDEFDVIPASSDDHANLGVRNSHRRRR